MASNRRSATSIAAVAVMAAVALGVGGAVAQDGAPAQPDADELLERLDALEDDLPVDFAPTAATLDAETSFGTLEGDARSVRAVLDTLEPDLRLLFVDADDAQGDVAAAVSLVAQGWLDVWTGSAALGAAEAHDLEFPTEATDELDVAADADQLRGDIETGLELVLQGRARHLAGYGALRELNAAEPEIQARLDERARSSRTFDEEVRPDLVAALGEASTTIMVPTERFVTGAPGVRSRATSMTVVCVDRDLYQESVGGSAAEAGTTLADAEVERDDCPAAPDELAADAEG